MAASKEFPLVMVEWEDASHDIMGWGDGMAGATQFELPFVRSVGWLLAQDKKGIKICQSITDDNVAQALAIPAAMIQKVTKLAVPKRGRS